MTAYKHPYRSDLQLSARSYDDIGRDILLACQTKVAKSKIPKNAQVGAGPRLNLHLRILVNEGYLERTKKGMYTYFEVTDSGKAWLLDKHRIDLGGFPHE